MTKDRPLLKNGFWLTVIGVILFIILHAGQSFNSVDLPTETEPVKLYSSDVGDDLEMTIQQAIQKGEKSISLVIYSLTDPKIIALLNKKSRDGVDVSITFDKKASGGLERKLDRRISKKPKNLKGLMHKKLLIVDSEDIWLGSANFTPTSLRMHNNLIVGLHHPEFALAVEAGVDRKSFLLGDQNGDYSSFPEVENGLKKLKTLIRSAKKTVKVAMFTWTRHDLAQEIILAKNRGIQTEVILDCSSVQGVSSKIASQLKKGGVNVRISPGNVLLHHKMLIIDDETLVTGSANWTTSAFTKNEDCFFILTPLSSPQKKKLTQSWDVLTRESRSY